MRMEPLRIGPRIQRSDINFRKALEQGLELTSTPRAQRKRGRSAKSPRKRVDHGLLVSVKCVIAVFPDHTRSLYATVYALPIWSLAVNAPLRS